MSNDDEFSRALRLIGRVMVRGRATHRDCKTDLDQFPPLRTMSTRLVPIAEIHLSPENKEIYRPVTPQDPAVQALADSIAECGIVEPLVITRDGFIVSGHRRYVAAGMAGLDQLPCRIDTALSRADDRDGFIVALREHNRQRVKSFDEIIREEIVSIDPEVAHQALLRERRQHSEVKLAPLDIRENGRARSGISHARQPFLKAVLKVLDDLKDFLPVSERQIHYNLLNGPPLIHASKPASRYCNDIKSARALSDLCTRARIFGDIPEDDIADETRPVTIWRRYPGPADFIREQLDGLFKGYYRTLLQSQPNHIEILVEKNTVASIVEQVAGRYGITMTSGRGYSSLPPRIQMKHRFKDSGKVKLVLLIVSDFDPEGEDIAHSFARSMKKDLKVDIHPIKVALKLEQTKDLTESLAEPKKKSSRRKRFIERYGKDQKVYELEALPPVRLQELVREAINGVVAHDLLNQEIRQEKLDAAQIQARRKAVLEALKDNF